LETIQKCFLVLVLYKTSLSGTDIGICWHAVTCCWIFLNWWL